MNKSKFIEELKGKLSLLDVDESKKIIDFYCETIEDKIDDGKTEEEAISELGDIDTIVENIMSETSLATIMQRQIKSSHDRSNNKALWIVLAILGSPIWLSILIALLSVIISLYISIWAIVISMYAVLLALGLSPILGIISCIGLFSVNILSGFAMIGASLVCAGLFLILLRPMILLTKKIIELTVNAIKKIKLYILERNNKNEKTN